MRSFVKVLSIVLAFLLLVPFCVNVFAEDTLENSDFEKLVALGIADETDIMENHELVSRSLFTKYAVKVAGIGDMVDAQYKNPFVDIDADNNAAEIKAAANLGLVSGTAPGYFQPELNITVAQAVKMLICALGYGQYAVYNGGYPSGYLIAANQLELTKGVSYKSDEYLTWSMFSRLVLNAFCTEVALGVGVVIDGENSETILESAEGITPLSVYYDIYETAGLLSSNSFTSINGKTEVSEGYVLVSGKSMKSGDTNAQDLLGYRVKGFYKVNSIGENVLLYIEKDNNKEYYAESEDIVPSGNSRSKFVYYEDSASERATALSLVGSVAMIYNGMLVDIDVAKLAPENGNVTLIDNNYDGVIDVVKVMDYKTIVVSNISASTYTLADKNGGSPLILDPESGEYTPVITENGEHADFGSIGAKTVISYASYPSAYKYPKYAVVSNTFIEGTVELRDTNGNITIDGIDYKYAPTCNAKLGQTGKFYLDFRGVIIDYEISERDYVYGFLNSIHKTEGLRGKVEVEIYSINKNWVVTTLADKITLDGEERVTPERFYELHSEDYRQLIRYNVNADGEVINIDFAETVDERTAADDEAIANNTFRLSCTLASSSYRKSPAGSFSGRINMIPAASRVFLIPPEETKYERNRFRIISNSSLTHGMKYYNIKAYDSNEVGVPAVVVCDENLTIDQGSKVYFVNDLKTVADEDGNAVYGLSLYLNDESPATFKVTKNELVDSIGGVERGDLIQMKTQSGKVTKINKVYDISESFDRTDITLSEKKLFIGSSAYTTNVLAGGFVTDIDTTYNKVRLLHGSNHTVFDFSMVQTFWIYDVDADILTAGTIADILEGDYMVARMSTLVAKNVVIYR